MLAVGLFVAFWVLVALGLVFIALSGGLGGARETLQRQTRRGRGVMATVFLATLLLFVFVLPGLLIAGNHDNANGQVGGIQLTSSEKAGRISFGRYCAVCHTLAAANASGKVGPNLDMLKPPAELVLHTIQNGCLQNPPTPNSPQACLGEGNMPADILEGKQAQEVSDFVGKVAGQE